MGRYKCGRKTAPSKIPLPALKLSQRPARRKQCSEEQMTAAMEAVQDGTATSINQAAQQHDVPASTLKDRSGRVIHGTKPGPVPYLSSKEEDELAVYLVEAFKLGYGKTRRQVKGIVVLL